MIREAFRRGIHVFCEKPLVIDPAESVELAALAEEKGIVTQVGYHNRFVGAFREVQRLLELGAIGTVETALAEAYGPVVLKPAGRTWRSQRATGGAASTTMRRTRSTCSRGTWASRSRSAAAS
jgi:predicted dehydrogenase